MESKIKLCRIFGIGFLILLFVNCTTFNVENVEKGVFFSEVYTNFYDQNLSFEEHCYVIILGLGTSISKINEQNASGKPDRLSNPYINRIFEDKITILPPGNYTFTIHAIKEVNSGYNTTTQYSANMDITKELQAGKYYFINTNWLGNKQVEYIVDELINYSELLVYGKIRQISGMIPVQSIIKGMDAKMLRTVKR